MHPLPSTRIRIRTSIRASTRAGAQVYNARHPKQTLLYRTLAEHVQTWLELASFRSV